MKANSKDELRKIREKIRELHDVLKIHPYFTSFNTKYARDCFNLFYEMEALILNFVETTEDEERKMTFYSNPQVALIYPFIHTFNFGFGRVMDGAPINDYIIQIQSVLGLYHAFADNHKTAILVGQGKEGHTYTMEAVWDKEKGMGWYGVRHVTREERDSLIEEFERKVETLTDDKSHTTTLRKIYEDRIKDLKGNNGKYYMLTELSA